LSLVVVEDAAQAHGATYRGKPIGSHSDAVAWSFYPGKNLGAMGDGGAVTSNRTDVIERVRLLSNYGSRHKHVNEIRGVNSRLDALQAAVLSARLKSVDIWTRRRSLLARRYMDGLTGCSYVLPELPTYGSHAWHLFVIRSNRRDLLQVWLQQHGVGTQIHYPVPPHLQAAYADLGVERRALPVASQLADEVLSLPMSQAHSEEQVDRVITMLREFDEL